MENLSGQSFGPYKIITELGHGGMATVYRAVQTSIGRDVAIKILPAHFLQERTFLERFNLEVQVITKLQHPRILPVIDFGDQDGTPYIVMAYMPGGTLADRIRQFPNGLPLEDIGRLVSQIAEALDYAHGEGVIHRDFKPSNVLLDKQGNAHLADFGIAKVTADTAQLTGSGSIGTPAYMAPETARAGGITPLIDVYALGVTVFEMLTGKHPFQAETPMGVMLAHANENVPDVRALRAKLKPGVQKMIERAMAKKPSARYQSAGALAADLRAALGVTGEATTPMPDIDPMTVSVAQSDTPRPKRTPPLSVFGAGRRLPKWARAALAVVVLLILVAGGLALAAYLKAPFAKPLTQLVASRRAFTFTQRNVLLADTEDIWDADFSPDGRSLITGAVVINGYGPKTTQLTTNFIVWDVQSGGRIRVVIPDLGSKYPVSLNSRLSPDGAAMVVPTGSPDVALVSLQDGRVLRWLAAPGFFVDNPIYSPDGKLIAAISHDGTKVLLWDVADGSLRLTLEAAAGIFESYPAFSPDSKQVAAGGEGKLVVIWDTQTGERLRTIRGFAAAVGYVIFSPDGGQIATSSKNGDVIVWDAQTGERALTLDARAYGLPTALAYSPDGTLLAADTYDGTVLVWNAASGERIATLDAKTKVQNRAYIYVSGASIAFSPDGKLLMSAGGDQGRIVLWDVGP